MRSWAAHGLRAGRSRPGLDAWAFGSGLGVSCPSYDFLLGVPVVTHAPGCQVSYMCLNGDLLNSALWFPWLSFVLGSF